MSACRVGFFDMKLSLEGKYILLSTHIEIEGLQKEQHEHGQVLYSY
jgi:hypothetical protein